MELLSNRELQSIIFLTTTLPFKPLDSDDFDLRISIYREPTQAIASIFFEGRKKKTMKRLSFGQWRKMEKNNKKKWTSYVDHTDGKVKNCPNDAYGIDWLRYKME